MLKDLILLVCIFDQGTVTLISLLKKIFGQHSMTTSPLQHMHKYIPTGTQFSHLFRIQTWSDLCVLYLRHTHNTTFCHSFMISSEWHPHQ